MSTITITEVGTIAAENPIFGNHIDGIDGAGIFGPAGASLIGQHFIAVFTGSDCDCTGGTASANPGATPLGTGISPVQDATLTINGITYHFGSGYYGDMLYTGYNLAQVNATTGMMFITPGAVTTGIGAFGIDLPQTPRTSGSFIGESISNSLFVPGPVAGADLSGLLVLIILGVIYWKHKP